MKAIYNRRSLLQVGATSLFGLQLSHWPTSGALGLDTAPVTEHRARNMILVWLDGAPSTIDMWDPKPGAPEYIRGEFSAIATAIPGVRVAEHLPQMAQVLDRCTLIRSLHHNIPEHGPGSQLMLTGHAPSPSVAYPDLGAVAARMLHGSGDVPSYVAFDKPGAATAGFLGSAWNAFELKDTGQQLPAGITLGEDADLARFSKRVDMRDRLDAGFDPFVGDPVAAALTSFQAQAARVLERDAVRRALDLSLEPESVLDRFGRRNEFAENALRARRLIEAGVRFVTVGLPGWDTHTNNFIQLRNNLLPQLDKVLSALILDLEERGLLDSTIVCCCGEFGRTPNVNGSAGRDHWAKAFSVVIAGGEFNRGLVHGQTDQQAQEPTSGGCTPGQLCATLLAALGVSPAATVNTRSGRPMRLIDEDPISELLE